MIENYYTNYSKNFSIEDEKFISASFNIEYLEKAYRPKRYANSEILKGFVRWHASVEDGRYIPNQEYIYLINDGFLWIMYDVINQVFVPSDKILTFKKWIKDVILTEYKEWLSNQITPSE